MKKKKGTICKFVFLFVWLLSTFAFGVVGLKMEGKTSYNAIFSTITMFFLNYTEDTSNGYVNVARYSACLFTLGAIINLFIRFLLKRVLVVKGILPDSTFVLGNNTIAEEFVKSIGFRSIRCNSSGEFIKAKRYVLLDDESSNFIFYDKNKKYLENKPVFFRSDSFSNIIIKNGNHRFFSVEELIARKYWKENSLIDLAFDGEVIKQDMCVIIIGFSKLGEELLYQSLQTNIFDVNQTIQYHIFGDAKKFSKLHKNFDQFNVVPHDDNWYDEIALLEKADKIIVDIKNANFTIINELLELIREGNIDILTDTSVSDEIILNHRTGRADSLKMKIIYWPEIMSMEGVIINEEGIIMAQKLNKKYADVHSSDKGKTQDKLWSELDTFDRYSNIAAVDYHYVREKLLKKWNCAIADYEVHIDKMAALEHKRWCVYHLYNNWTYCRNPVENDPKKTKNKELRLHMDLLPYEELPIEEQEKDKTQIRYLFEVFGDNYLRKS